MLMLAFDYAAAQVPFGQLVGNASYTTLDRLYTGYGEAPSQRLIRERGFAYLNESFPKLDYINECRLVTSSFTRG